MNPAVAYLVLAAFSDRSNRISRASTNAIEKYTGISRWRAKDAIASLCEKGFLEKLQGGSKPRYDIMPFSKLGRGVDRLRMDAEEQPDWIWLPNALVTGVVEELPPIERLRQTQEVLVLRLFVDLYHGHHLAADGGVSRRHLSKVYHRQRVANRNEYQLFEFTGGELRINWTPLLECHRKQPSRKEKVQGADDRSDLVQRLDTLGDVGLIEWIPYLAESSDSESELLHPLGGGEEGSWEERVGIAAVEAGRVMLGDDDLHERLVSEGVFVIPVVRHLQNASVVEVARLRYRPHTRATALWCFELADKSERYLAEYNKLTDFFVCRAS